MSGSARWFPASAKAPSDAPYPSISDLQSGRARCHGDREPARPASSRVECPAARAGFPPQRRRHRTRLILRSQIFNLGALAVTEIESRLAQLRPEWNVRQRALVSRLSEGAIGRALSFDLESYVAARNHALIMLKSALGGSDSNAHTELFKTTESYRSGAEGRAKIDILLRTFYSLLEDLMFLQSGTAQLVRNTDILGELKKISEAVDFAWVQRAVEGLGEVEQIGRAHV